MIVYVESNFILELALEQEDSRHCERLLELAERGAIGLAFPAYALLEPSETITRRVAEWNRLSQEVERELKQLRRTASLRSEADALAGLTAKAVVLAKERHDNVRSRVLATCPILAVDARTLVEAERLKVAFGLTLPDAVMLACVLLADASPTPSVFVNKNVKDFADPGVRAELIGRGCRFIGKFEDGLAFVEAALARTGS